MNVISSFLRLLMDTYVSLLFHWKQRELFMLGHIIEDVVMSGIN